MPGMDGTGPMEAGSMTGRGFGPCADGKERNFGSGSGFRRRFACGSARRRGFGRGLGLESTSKSEKELLKEQKEILQGRLEEIDERLEDL